MKIQVGKTYRNAGAGRTMRTVIAIGRDKMPDWYSSGPRIKHDPVVTYIQSGKERRLWLSSFIRWVGSEVIDRQGTPSTSVQRE